jgi:hypothetical protein
MGRVWSVDAIAKNASTDIFGQLTSIAESKFDPNMLWVGTDDGLIQMTTDGGKSWTKFDNIPGCPKQSYVHQIITSLFDKNTAFVCFNHHRYGDFKPYIFKTTDAGKSWTPIQSNLPERGSVYSIAQDHVNPDLLFVGTEFGLYFSNDGGQKWIRLKSGLPTIAVRDIDIQRRENDLVLATFGRGFYILDDYSLLRDLKKDDLDKPAILFPVKDSWMFIENLKLGLRDKGHMGSSYYSAPNPKQGAVFTYYLKDDIKKIKDIRKKAEKALADKKESVFYPSIDSLRIEDNQPDPYLIFTVKDQAGNVIRNLKAPAKKGLQRTVWDFRYPTPAPINNRFVPDEDELFSEEEIGSKVAPGQYTVTLSKYDDGVVTDIAGPVKFTCKQLENSSLPTDLAANDAFCQKVADIRKAVSAADDIATTMETRLKNINLAVLDAPAPVNNVLQKARELKRQMIAVDVQLFGDQTRSRREFEAPPSINARISDIQGTVWNTTSIVPSTCVESYAVAAKQFSVTLNLMKSLDAEIQKLEKELEIDNAPYTTGRWPDWK